MMGPTAILYPVMTSMLALQTAGILGGDSLALSMNFLTGALDSHITYARASAATDIIGGVLTDFASGNPRISTQNGLLIEHASTNSLRNSEAQGATVGVLGSGGALPTNWSVSSAAGLTTEVVATGTSNGFNYVRVKISGTPTGTTYALLFDGTTQVTAAQNDKWAASLYALLNAGSMTNITSVNARLDERDAAGALLAATSAPFSLTSSFTRAVAKRTMASASTGRVTADLHLALTIGLAVDITLDLAAPQLELNGVATSYIRTTGAAATRARDDVEIFSAKRFFKPIDGASVIVEATMAQDYDTSLSIVPRFLDIGSSATDTIGLRYQPTTQDAGLAITVASVSQTNSTTTDNGWPMGTTKRAAFAWDYSGATVLVQGESPFKDTSANLLPPFSGYRIGSRNTASPNGGWLNGYLRKMDFYATRLTDSVLAQKVSIPAAAQSFSPQDITNLVGWWDASSPTTVINTAGAVSEWRDMSGKNNTLVQPTGAQQPTTGTRTLNGLNVLDFDGTADNLIAPSALYGLSNGENTLFIVMVDDNTGDAQHRFIGGSGGGTERFSMQNTATTLAALNRLTAASGPQITVTRDTSPHIAVSRRSLVDHTIWQDGSSTSSTANHESFTMTSLIIGAQASNANRLDGVLAEVIFFNRALTNAEINQVSAYLAAKWGTTWTSI